MLKKDTQQYYQNTINKVLLYIKNNLDGNLSVDNLAHIFGISKFHFHRIFKANVKESIGAYINRIRLETAITLIRMSDMPIGDIAVKIGFTNQASFSKAFSKEFSISPLHFKDDKSIELNTNIDYFLNKQNSIDYKLKPKKITLPETRVYYIRVLGEYGGNEMTIAWDELIKFATENKLWGWRPNAFSVYYDDPEVVDTCDCRADFCIASNKKSNINGRISTKTIEGGKFVAFRYKGSWNFMQQLYELIYSTWLLNTTEVLRDAPVFEKYINYGKAIKPENYLTEVYIPIK